MISHPFLAIDSSTDATALLVVRGPDDSRASVEAAPGRHGRSLVLKVDELLKELGMAPRDLKGIAVGRGPGSYTGLRIAATAAKALAYAVGAPLFSFDALELLAASLGGEGPIVAVSDAQRGTVYRAEFLGVEGDVVRTAATRIVSLVGALEGVPSGARLIGPRWDRLAVPKEWSPLTVLPTASGLGKVALRAELVSDLWAFEPDYLRPSSAEEKALAK